MVEDRWQVPWCLDFVPDGLSRWFDRDARVLIGGVETNRAVLARDGQALDHGCRIQRIDGTKVPCAAANHGQRHHRAGWFQVRDGLAVRLIRNRRASDANEPVCVPRQDAGPRSAAVDWEARTMLCGRTPNCDLEAGDVACVDADELDAAVECVVDDLGSMFGPFARRPRQRRNRMTAAVECWRHSAWRDAIGDRRRRPGAQGDGRNHEDREDGESQPALPLPRPDRRLVVRGHVSCASIGRVCHGTARGSCPGGWVAWAKWTWSACDRRPYVISSPCSPPCTCRYGLWRSTTDSLCRSVGTEGR